MPHYAYYPLHISEAIKNIVQKPFNVNLPGMSGCQVQWNWQEVEGRFVCTTRYNDIVFMAAHRCQKKVWQKKADKAQIELQFTPLMKLSTLKTTKAE